jgi:hypothetical protein
MEVDPLDLASVGAEAAELTPVEVDPLELPSEEVGEGWGLGCLSARIAPAHCCPMPISDV